MKIHYFVPGLLMLCLACSSNVKETPKGYKYTLVKQGSGETVKEGEYLMLNLMFKDAKDSVWTDTQLAQAPMIYEIASSGESSEGIDEIFATLKKGDSVVFSIPTKVVFEKNFRQVMPENMDGDADLTFNVGVKNILTSGQLQIMEQEFADKRSKAQLENDIAVIDEYLAQQNIEANTTPSGLRYVISKEGTGDNAAAGDEVSIHYAGYLLDGTFFDSSIGSVARENNTFLPGRTYDPFSLTAGSGQVIPGWEEAILLMKKGTKMRVWIPSPLAYGPQRRSAVIGENSILVFDMEMIGIKKQD